MKSLNDISLRKEKSPHTEHQCFMGQGCDLWWRKDGASITCGITNWLIDDKIIIAKPLFVLEEE